MVSVIGWFEILVGVAITGLWIMLLVTQQVPQIPAGRRDIWFHLTAELVTAALLVGAGSWLLLAGGHGPRLLSALGLGALLYTTINSPGYYADRDDWPTVAMFAVLAVVTVVAGIVLVLSVS